MEWDSFFSNLSTFLLNISCREENNGVNVAESVLINIQCYLRVLYSIKETLEEAHGGDSELIEVLQTVSELIIDVENVYSRWTFIESGVEDVNTCYGAVRVRVGVGRPRVIIEKEKMEFLRELCFTWTDIASIFGVCRRTVYNIRSENGMLNDQSQVTPISDEELYDVVRTIKRDMPEIGYNMLKGVLRSKGILVSIPRIQQSLHAIDPINTALRWASPVSRRVYGVPYPNFLWHLDGNHKLVRWGFVVHGGIDGYSRLIVYLQCSGNNRSDTVLKYFLSGVQLYGLPEHVHTDRGGENVQIAEYMLTNSVAENPVIVGSSVHNVRIERLWRDTFRCVLSVFYQLFNHMESCGKLDPLAGVDLYCLHYVFLPRIAKALEMFKSGWNNHAITTENCKTPLQLFTKGSIIHGPWAQPFPTSSNYGELPVSSGVTVPEFNSPLSDEKEQELRHRIDPLQLSSNYEIELFDGVKDFVLNNINT